MSAPVCRNGRLHKHWIRKGDKLCPECLCERQQVRLKFLRYHRHAWGCVVSVYEVYRCPHCRTKLVGSLQYGMKPEPAVDWI